MAQWVNDLACLCGMTSSIPSPVQWVEDPALLQLWQVQLGFDPWPRASIYLGCGQKRKRKKKCLCTGSEILILIGLGQAQTSLFFKSPSTLQETLMSSQD